jgi:tetratricopeptide (TPR) repeat protein/transcriptional regulator with XRE-family HTH domain
MVGTSWSTLPVGLNPAARRLVGELRTLKDEHGLSLAQLSAATHYSRASWERWLNGKRLITAEALAAVATRFGADLVLLTTLLREASLLAEPGEGAAAVGDGIEAAVELGDGVDSCDDTGTGYVAAASEVLAGFAGDTDIDEEPPRSPLAAQLPASTSDFTGRRSQVEDLCAALLPGVGAPGQVSVAAITGGGGLGKTTLAVHVAHRVAERFPDGQLYINLNGALENALRPESVLGQWLRALGEDASALPAGVEERAALFRSRLSRRRVLLVLDNARDAEQIRPLLPATNECAVLITSRNRLTELPGAYKLNLSSLPDDEAMILLAQLVGADRLAAEPEATAELLRACDGMPLALRIAGARLGARANWAVSTLAWRLSDRRRRLDELAIGDLAARACFDVSYAALPRPGFDGNLSLERAFRLLGLVAGPDISLPAAASLLGLSEAHAELVLEGLVDTHLLDSPEPDRYRMHDLVRLYAAERAAADEDEAERAYAVERLIGWYVASAADAHRVLSPQSRAVPVEEIKLSCPARSFTDHDEGLDWCERERADLVAAVLQAAEFGLSELSWKLAAAMLGFFNARRYLADWTSTHLAALGAAQAAGDLVGEAWMQNNLGFVYFYWQETERKALVCFERSLEIRVQLGDRIGESIALNNLGTAAHRLGENAKAIAALEKAMEIREELGDQVGALQAILNLGQISGDEGQHERAESYLLRALRMAEELALGELVVKSLTGLGTTYIDLSRLEDAKRYLYRALDLCRSMRHVDSEAITMQNLAIAHNASGELETALNFWQQALALYERFEDPEADIVRAEMAEALGSRR